MAKKRFDIRAAIEFGRNLWEERISRPPEEMSRLHRFAHFWVLVGKSFSRNRCPARASALAYATLLALIPMLAVVVSITSTFLKKEGEERIDEFIAKLVSSVTPPDGVSTNLDATTLAITNSIQNPGIATVTTNTAGYAPDGTNATQARPSLHLPAFANEDEAIAARKEIAKRIHDFISRTRSGALGLTGTALLIFAAISMLSRIEDTFNDIWGAVRGRTWFTRIVLYWAVFSLGPILLVVALGLLTGSHLESARRLVNEMPFSTWFLSQCLPVLLLGFSFAAFYKLIPNARVEWGAAITGGMIGGGLWHLNNLASYLFVSRVVSNSKIYGSMALVPVLMIGLYISWMILLFGAQVAYAFQNRVTYFEEKQVDQITQRGREFIALRLLTCIGQRYLRGEPPLCAPDILRELAVPTRLTHELMRTLSSANLVVATSGAEPAYVPARPLESITCYDVLSALRAGGGQVPVTRDEPVLREVYGEFHRIEDAERQAASAVTLLALVQRAGQQKAIATSPNVPPREPSEPCNSKSET